MNYTTKKMTAIYATILMITCTNQLVGAARATMYVGKEEKTAQLKPAEQGSWLTGRALPILGAFIAGLVVQQIRVSDRLETLTIDNQRLKAANRELTKNVGLKKVELKHMGTTVQELKQANSLGKRVSDVVVQILPKLVTAGFAWFMGG